LFVPPNILITGTAGYCRSGCCRFPKLL